MYRVTNIVDSVRAIQCAWGLIYLEQGSSEPLPLNATQLAQAEATDWWQIEPIEA